MENGTNSRFAEQIAGALDWWRDAGVDCDFTDLPADWIAPAPVQDVETEGTEPRPAVSGDAPVPREPRTPLPVPDLPLDSMPHELSAWVAWWLAEPALDDGRVGGRVPPRGVKQADVMVIVPEPEREDGKRLLAGPEGRLLSAMLEAMGGREDNAYIASALPRHTPMADWPAQEARGMGEVLRRHIALVGPKRLIMLGGNILSLTGNDPAQGSAVLRVFNHEGTSIPLLAARSLRAMLERPRWKAKLWQAWLDWTA